MNQIHIVHIITSLNMGGAEIMILNLSREILKLDPHIKFSVISMRNSMALRSAFEDTGIKVYTLDSDNRKPIKKIFYGIKLLRELKPTIVHTHTLVADQWGLLIAFLAGIKNRISTAHNVAYNPTFYDYAVRQVSSLLSQKIVVVSESSKEYFIQHKMYQKSKMHLIYNAPGHTNIKVQLKTFDLKSPLKILSLGRFDVQKGQIYFLEAIAQLSKDLYQIEMYGEDTGIKKSISDFIQTNSLTHVSLKDPAHNISELFSQNHVFMATSLFESFHMALLEAMHAGMVPILTDIPIHRELFKNIPDYPFFVRLENSQDIKLILKMIHENPSLISEYSAKVHGASLEFSIENLIKNYHNLYQSLSF